MSRQMQSSVVVGAGQAGLRAAERLRELGHTGRLTVVGDEPRMPYNRTPLSKQLLTGHLDPRDLRLPVWDDLDIDWRLGVDAIGLDPAGHVLELADGELAYDGLVLAGGVRARHLPGTPLHSPHVWMLRDLDDARQIDHLLERAKHVVVVGGGFIGCELASTCRERVLDVTIVDVSTTLLHRGLGSQLVTLMGDIHADHGVALHLGTAVKNWSEHDSGVAVELDGGEHLHADLVVVGVGTTPNVDWRQGTPLDISDGVLCTATCHATGVDDVVACGDLARWPNQRFSAAAPERVEHWLNAIEMGQHAAESLLLGPEAARAFAPIPRFWSEQHGHRIQSVGRPDLGGHMSIAEGSTASRQFVAVFERDARIVGAIGLDSPRRMIHYRKLIDEEWPAGTLSRSAS